MISGHPADVTLNCAWQVGIVNIDGQMLVLLRLKLGDDREAKVVMGLADAEKIAAALMETSANTRQERIAAALRCVRDAADAEAARRGMAEPQGSA